MKREMKLLKSFGIKTNNIKLYEEALTHSSYAHEKNTKSYERLEFLGDAVLELIISEYLYQNHQEDEGIMTKLRAHYVCEAALYEYSLKLHLDQYIRLGHGEKESGGKYQKAKIADIFESFLGALYLDKGLRGAKRFLYKYVIPMIEAKELEVIGDYKSLLQEMLQTSRKGLEYIVVKEQGPSHKKVFTVEAKIDNIVYGKGTGFSKKEAEQLAAKDAFKKMVK